MALLLRNNAIFLHIPKTGGSFVSRVLEDLDAVKRPVGHIHGSYESSLSLTGRLPIGRAIAGRTKGYVPRGLKQKGKEIARSNKLRIAVETDPPYTFCFVRDPLAWYESFWQYMYQRCGPDWSNESDLLDRHPCGSLAKLGHEKFEKFVEAVVVNEPGFVTQLYSRYVADGPSFVGRQESLVDDLLKILDDLEVAHDKAAVRSMEPVNASGRRQFNWPEELRSEVERLEYPTRVRFGYPSVSS